LQPTLAYVDGQLRFDLLPGLERKGTGSYYTPPELVEALVKSALLPELEDRLRHAGTPQEREKRLLEMSIYDPACGSGHFLLAAARRLARELAAYERYQASMARDPRRGFHYTHLQEGDGVVGRNTATSAG